MIDRRKLLLKARPSEQRPKVFTLDRVVSRRLKRVHARKRKGKTGLRGSCIKNRHQDYGGECWKILMGRVRVNGLELNRVR
ncbi:hypothetical protein HanIR_Chr16g0835731 [Helianthus annuus]|nr:hypothetical protein HanIR_Chr16g0835731 [Helianthus annuus]